MYACEHKGCDAQFSRRDRLLVHTRIHTGDRPFVCDEVGCHKQYTRSQHLRRHKVTAHNGDSRARVLSQEALRCPVSGCDSVLYSHDAFIKHQRSHRRRVHRCAECGRSFIKRQHLLIHQYEHTGVLPFACAHAECTRSFLTPSRLRTHLARHERVYTCTYCPAVLDTWKLLVQHRRQCRKKKQQLQRFSCEQCDLVLKSMSAWQSHLRTHDSPQYRKFFACTVAGCSRKYLYQRNLVQHMRKPHERHAFICQFEACGRKFRSEQRFSAHMRCHHSKSSCPSVSGAAASTDAEDDAAAECTGGERPFVGSSPGLGHRRLGDHKAIKSTFSALTGLEDPGEGNGADRSTDGQVLVSCELNNSFQGCGRAPSQREQTQLVLRPTNSGRISAV